MTTHLAAMIAVGLLMGAGLWLCFVRLPVMRKTSFAQRVEPQLRSVDSRSRLLEGEGPGTLFGPLERIFRLVLSDAVHRLGRFNVSVRGLGVRLEQAGRSETPLEFRAMQFLCAAAGLLAGVVGAILLLWQGTINFMGAVVLTLAPMVGGYLFYDYLLGARTKRRQAQMLSEFPALAELMALAVSAGESASGALDRVARTSNGVLSQEFGKVLAQTRTGVPLVEALNQFSARVNVPALSRFVDGIGVAVNRGTPLAEVLRAQAQDVRDVAKRELMESAGRKEIGMMVPLIFGVLPLTVVFAVFPGLALLQFGF
ncbi:tight adherence protein C [Arthrobacter stackebrandtii]|uniref:Tight adherence protein C n=1 Tax=Arthrobacter stackebrandtii TaxID=272161 RepID=A0ABS4YYD4_9MICC|nr:type II secretion system F family protein [Arthrobacter stackebrandtii]MBP2413783.1 tight adherence protein C [Arthrobacter stackebrandtii]PYH00368.1 type II secretion system protein F [Arthrobacter stackebrandtii]